MRLRTHLARLALLLAAALLLAGTAAAGAEPSWEERLAQAREKYNQKTVNVYRRGRGRYRRGKINACFYASSIKPNIIINIRESLQVTDEAEMQAILEQVVRNDLYDEETYGTLSFMKAQWIAHNLAYSMATGTAGQKRLLEALLGDPLEEILGSSKELDLSPLGMTPERQIFLYRLIETLYCHPETPAEENGPSGSATEPGLFFDPAHPVW